MTDHERLCELLARFVRDDDWDMNHVATAKALIARLRSDGPDGIRVVPVEQSGYATSVSIHGMYDCHLFHQFDGHTVDEVISLWREHNLQKHPAIVGGEKVDDLGPLMLCPATVLSGKKELRRVGSMIFPGHCNEAEIQAYRTALLNDTDIPRLLRAGGERD